MYEKKTKQVSFDENPNSFICARLSPENRWVKLAQIIPWSRLEGRYHQTFANPKVGNPAKSCRMAIGSLIIKERMKLSDIETVELIRENPYIQFFIGLNNFTDYMPFDTSTMTYFRKRLTPEILAEINALIVEANKDDNNNHDDNASGDTETPAENTPEPKNEGTLILDATCAPADVHFPTNVILLNDSRVKLEEMIDDLHEGSDEKKPRTYRQKAQTLYLRFARNRRPRYKQIRRAIREQLGFVRRDLDLVQDLLSTSNRQLAPRQIQYWQTIQDVYQQQLEMYKERKHKVEDRIVSIHQPWVRPIVRGKATADIEFGAKISVNLVNGYALIEQLDWNDFNESGDLQVAVERYRERHGY